MPEEGTGQATTGSSRETVRGEDPRGQAVGLSKVLFPLWCSCVLSMGNRSASEAPNPGAGEAKATMAPLVQQELARPQSLRSWTVWMGGPQQRWQQRPPGTARPGQPGSL